MSDTDTTAPTETPIRLPLVAIQEGSLTRTEVRRKRDSLEFRKNAAVTEIRKKCLAAEERELVSQEQLFIPSHGPSQLISPRLFFNTPLFRACAGRIKRAGELELQLAPGVSYSGPELRQSDSLVFMSLLHLTRDVNVGALVTFSPKELCEAIYGRYDGPSRKRLQTAIKRLQKGVIEFSALSVQLCQEFQFPKNEWWSVGMHRQIVDLFVLSPRVWISIAKRLELSEGLTTWLYTYIQSNQKLIPEKVSRLQALSGSESGIRAFSNNLRISLKRLMEHNIVADGAKVAGGVVRWKKYVTA